MRNGGKPAAMVMLSLLAACGGAENSATPAPAPGLGNVAIAPANTAPLVPAAPVAPAAPPASGDQRVAISIDGEGLRLVDPASGATRPIAFGAPRAAVLEALAGLGTPETTVIEECSLPIARFANGLTVNFEDDAFAGWSLDRDTRTVTTMAGVGPGSTRAELEDAHDASVDESSLGTEFTVGDMAGVLDGTGRTARITSMWAGVNCIAR